MERVVDRREAVLPGGGGGVVGRRGGGVMGALLALELSPRRGAQDGGGGVGPV